ncbi:hypothetical protein [Streptomyces sp. NPDC002587]
MGGIPDSHGTGPAWVSALVHRAVSGDGRAQQDRAAGLYYFVQAEAGAPWKAAAKTWATDKPAPQLQPGQHEDHVFGNFGFEVRDKPISALARDEAGAVVLSPTAAVDRGVCGRYAEYLSFTAPDGEPKSDYFVPGKLTSDFVGAYNGEDGVAAWKGAVRFRYAFDVTGVELPVLRLADGKSLVTCTFTRAVRSDSKPRQDARFKFGNAVDGDACAGCGAGGDVGDAGRYSFKRRAIRRDPMPSSRWQLRMGSLDQTGRPHRREDRPGTGVRP